MNTKNAILFVAALISVLLLATVSAGSDNQHRRRKNPIVACFAGKTEVFRASHILSETDPTDMPDNNMHFRRYVHYTVEQNGYRKESFNFSGGVGTTMDAQTHVNGSTAARKICDYTPEELHSPLVLLDVRRKAANNPDYTVSIQDVLDWEEENGRIPKGAFVAMWSGWDAKYRNEVAYRNTDPNGYPFHFPGFGTPVTNFLLNFRDIHGIGTDTLSADNGATFDYGEHTNLVGRAGKYNIENLRFDERIPAEGACIVVNPLLVCSPESTSNVNIYY